MDYKLAGLIDELAMALTTPHVFLRDAASRYTTDAGRIRDAKRAIHEYFHECTGHDEHKGTT